MNDHSLDEIMTGLEAFLNKQLPRTKKKLSQLLEMDHPQVVCRDGSVHSFKRKELEMLSSLLSPDDRGRLELPIVIISNPQYGEGAVGISGEVETQVVSRLLQMDVEEEKHDLVLYRPQLEELRRKLRTTTQIAFLQVRALT